MALFKKYIYNQFTFKENFLLKHHITIVTHSVLTM